MRMNSQHKAHSREARGGNQQAVRWGSIGGEKGANYLRVLHLVTTVSTLDCPYLVKYISASSAKTGSGMFLGKESPSMFRDSTREPLPPIPAFRSTTNSTDSESDVLCWNGIRHLIVKQSYRIEQILV